MDLDELLAAKPPDNDEPAVLAPGTVRVAPLSPTVYDQDRWCLRRGEQIAEEWASQNLVDWPDECDQETEKAIVADAHTVLFEHDPQFVPNPADKSRAAWFKQLQETPEHRALKAQTCHDPDLAALAAKPIVESLLKHLADADEGDDPGGDEEDIETTMERIDSVGEALKSAQQDVSTAQDLRAGLGMGASGGPIDRALLAKCFSEVQNDKRLRDILGFAGRMIRLSRSLQQQKTNASRGEITGTELGGDVSRLVMKEKIELSGAVPALLDEALYRLIQKRSMCYKHKKNEPKQSGPFVCFVDGSGSMTCEDSHGVQRIVAAKALAIAMAWLASYQNRWCVLVDFYAGKTNNTLVLPPKHKKQAELIEWATHFYSGQSTDLVVPLEHTPQVLWPKFVAEGLPQGKTDSVIITDGCMDCSDSTRDSYLAWAAAEQVKTYGIIIGEQRPGGLEHVTDHHWCLNDLDLECEAVSSVLSI